MHGTQFSNLNVAQPYPTPEEDRGCGRENNDAGAVASYLSQGKKNLARAEGNKESVSARKITPLEKQVLACYLRHPVVIDSAEHLETLLDKRAGSADWILRHTDESLLRKILDIQFIERFRLKTCDIPEQLISQQLAYECLNAGLWSYSNLPEQLKTNEFIQFLIDEEYYWVLNSLPEYHGLTVNYDFMVEKSSSNLRYVPKEYQTILMCMSAVKDDSSNLEFVSPELDGYDKLVEQALKEDVLGFKFIPDEYITEDMVEKAEKALEIKQKVLPLHAIPESFRTLRRCRKFVSFHIKNNYSFDLKLIPKQHFIQSQELLNLCMSQDGLLAVLPEFIKTEAFCQYYLENRPSSLEGMPVEWLKKKPEWVNRALECDACSIKSISPDLFEQNPQWLEKAAREGTLKEIPETLRTLELCQTAIMSHPKNYEFVPEAKRKKLDQELLLAVAPQSLDSTLRERLFGQEDTSLRDRSTRLTGGFLHHEHLLQPLAPPLSTQGNNFSCGFFLKKELLSCPSFHFRNQTLGERLQEDIKTWTGETIKDLSEWNLPILGCLPSEIEAYGGRTALSKQRGHCVRFKFLREKELLSEFFREASVHRFAQEHAGTLCLKSEVPVARGIRLLPVENIRPTLLKSFKSPLEKVIKGNQSFYLVYEFTTRDRCYSTLAYQRDKDGGTKRADNGILKACHDLGVWSSLGAVHTSTIKAFHNFESNRCELFLPYPISDGSEVGHVSFPGVLDGWDKAAIEESDWGYTGLRDIGDMEFYPAIKSCFEAREADKILPPGYDQRCAFMEAFVKNMVAAFLHYARLHRDDRNYHYKNGKGIQKTADFLERFINAYLKGLTGSEVTMVSFFESREIYCQWLRSAVQEAMMWTEHQSLDKDCYASHLEKNGRFPPEVYPVDNNSKKYDDRYPHNFLFPEGHKLGCDSCQIGITLIIRGLYQVSAGLAGWLAGTSYSSKSQGIQTERLA